MKVNYANLVDIEIYDQNEITTAVEFLGGVIDRTIDKVIPAKCNPTTVNNPAISQEIELKKIEIQKLEADLQHAIAERDIHLKSYNDLEELYEETKDENLKLRDNNDVNKNKIEELEKEIETLKANILKLESELDGAYSQINDLSASNTSDALEDMDYGIPRDISEDSIQFTKTNIDHVPVIQIGPYDFINCTKHDVILKDSTGEVTAFPPSGINTRCMYNAMDVTNDPLANIVRTEVINGVIDVPPQRQNKIYIVSRLVYDTFPDRCDFVTPNSIAENTIRDNNNNIVAVKSLICRNKLINKGE